MVLTRTRLGFLILALAANLALASGMGVKAAHACSCAGGSSLDRQIRTSDAVFSGEVKSIEPNELAPGVGPPLGRVGFDVEGSWKGVSEESVVVYGYGNEVSCGVEFERGESYLVYASRASRDEDDPLETNFCTPTKPLENADGDLRILGSQDVPMPDTGGYVFSPAAFTAVIVAVSASLLLSGGLLVARRERRGDSRAGRG